MSFSAITAAAMKPQERWGDFVPETFEMREAFGDLVPASDYPLNDLWARNSSLAPITSIEDREDGKFAPVFETETDLKYIRGTSRRLEQIGPYIPSALSTLRAYTMGNGPTLAMLPKSGKAKPDSVSEAMQPILDKIQEQLALPSLLNEIHDRSRTDGESVVVVHPVGEDGVITEIVEPDQLTEPMPSADLNAWISHKFRIDLDSFVPSWMFGVLTQRRYTDRPLGYHVVYDVAGVDFEFYPASQVVHIRRNVPAKVKRGLPDWYVCWKDLKNEAKLAESMGLGAALQASIPWIEEMPPGTTQAQAASLGPTDLTIPIPTNVNTGGGTRNQKFTQYIPGTIIRTSPGRKFQPGPLGAERNGNFELVGQMLRRRIGIRHSIPEYMISGDASNANFASTLVSESPFVKAREADQEFMRNITKGLLWKSIAAVPRLWGQLGLTFEELRANYEIKVDFPQVQNRDPDALTKTLEAQKRNGWVSDQTAMTELGRDPEEEVAQGAAPAAPETLGTGSLNPEMGQRIAGAMKKALESVEGNEEAKAALTAIWEGYP